jgi:hypothetical protein
MPEPWSGDHLCNLPLDFWKLPRSYQEELWRTRPELKEEGKIEFVAEFPESMRIWQDLLLKGQT